MNMKEYDFLKSLKNYINYDEINTLDRKDLKIKQPEKILRSLKNYQKTCIYEMLRREYLFKINIRFHNYNHSVNTNIGILADSVGAGKTYITLGLIANKKSVKKFRENICFDNMLNMCLNKIPVDIITIITNYTTFDENNRHEFVLSKEDCHILDSNLIVVSHGIFHQWYKDIKKYSKLSIYPVRTKKDKLDIEEFKKHDIVLCNANKYNDIAKLCAEYKWNRVIFDEADSISIPRNLPSNFNFIWFITSTFRRLQRHKNIGFIRNIFRRIDYETRMDFQKILMNGLVVKNNENYIKETFEIPKFEKFITRCPTPIELKIVKDSVDKTVLDMLNANNFKDAIQRLKLLINTNNVRNISNDLVQDNLKNDNVVQLTMKLLNKKIDGLNKRLIEYNETIREIYQQNNNYLNYFKRMKEKVTKDIIKYKNMFKNIKLYIQEHDLCLICLNSIKDPSGMLKCCKRLFCLDCLVNYYSELNFCFYCHCLIKHKNDIIIVNKNNYINNEEPFGRFFIDGMLLTLPKLQHIEDNKDIKIDKVIDIINLCKDGRILIFANYDETLYQIQDKLDLNSIKYGRLYGHSNTIRKRVRDYTSGELKLLLLNSKFYGSGLNLQMTTDIIIFHSLDKSTETQVIGRAQRMGRLTNLNIHYLYYEHEIVNKE